MSTNQDVKNALANGHEESNFGNHKNHSNSAYSVTKDRINCQYTYKSNAGNNKANLTQDTDTATDGPGGNNHMTVTHPASATPDENGMRWNEDILSTGRRAYSGFTGRELNATKPGIAFGGKHASETVSGAVIHIDKTNGYQSGTESGGSTKAYASVSETGDDPMHLIRVYTHYYYKYVDGTNDQYKKMTGTVSFTNGGKPITKPSGGGREYITENNVHYVHVYYFGGVPTLICVAKDKTSSEKEYKYYKPETTPTNPFPDTTEWTDITGSGTGKLDGTKHPNDNKTRLQGILWKQYQKIIFYYVLSITVIG